MVNISNTDSYTQLRAFTHARIALGNTAGVLPLHSVLSLQLAQAMAKDALTIELDLGLFENRFRLLNKPYCLVQSQANSLENYLKRPDLGRLLTESSVEKLKATAFGKIDIVFIVSDGLSAGAANTYAPLVLEQFLKTNGAQYNIALVGVKRGRVAISDQIGALLGAPLAVILLGERPGLSNPQSLGIYLTYKPQIGNTDEQRNCISNIQENGLSIANAVQQLRYLCHQSFLQNYSGVHLKMVLDLPAKALNTNL